MSLSAAAITELTTESAPFKILAEWLKLWFDGADHAVGVNTPVNFPQANIEFGQSAPEQPLHDAAANTAAEIRVVLLPRMESSTDNANVLYDGKLVTAHVLLNFWISAKKPGKGQSELLAERIAEQLKAILTNPDSRYPLAEKGLAQLTPQAPQWIRSADYAKRLVACGALIQYPVQFGDSIVSPPSGDEQSVALFHEDPLIAGNYLLGAYQWSSRKRLSKAKVIGWAPQGSAVVLGLEVNGVLSAETLTLPVGTENTEVDDTAILNVTVNPNQPVRWKVLSAPVAQDSAWHVALTMQVQPLG